MPITQAQIDALKSNHVAHGVLLNALVADSGMPPPPPPPPPPPHVGVKAQFDESDALLRGLLIACEEHTHSGAELARRLTAAIVALGRLRQLCEEGVQTPQALIPIGPELNAAFVTTIVLLTSLKKHCVGHHHAVPGLEMAFDGLLAEVEAIRVLCLHHPEPPIPPAPPTPTPNEIVLDRQMAIDTLHIPADKTLISRPGMELIFNDKPPTDAALADIGLHIDGATWITDGVGDMVIRSLNPAGNRGHVMVMGKTAKVDISGIEFRDLGRTDKSIPLKAGVNPPGRYAMHFHRCGFSYKHTVKDCKVTNAKSWGFVNHSSNVAFGDNLIDGAFGAAFVAEGANALGDFFDNIAKNIKGKPVTGIPAGGGTFQGGKMAEILEMQKTGDVAQHGHGFWFDNPAINASGNWVENCRDQPYFDFGMLYNEFDTKRPAVPNDGSFEKTKLGIRKDNGATGTGGHELWFLTNPENVVEDSTYLDCTKSVISGRGNQAQTSRGLRAVCRPGVPAIAVNLLGPYGSRTKLFNSYIEGFGIGITFSTVGTSVVDGATFVNNKADVVIDQGPNKVILRNVGDDPKILMRDYLKYQTPTKIYSTTQRIQWESPTGNFRVQWKEQHPDYVLWQGSQYPVSLRGKTNRQIFDELGLAPTGFLVPDDSENKGGWWKTPEASVKETAIPHRSTVNLNADLELAMTVGTNRRLQFEFNGKDRIEMVNIVKGWNAFTFVYDGLKTTVFATGK